MPSCSVRIPAEYLKQVRRRIPLSRLIRGDIALSPRGNVWLACCPFHKEKTPSFFVSDEYANYHCFGCGAKGSAIDWLVNYRRLSFLAAVEYLAGEKPPTASERWEDGLRTRVEQFASRPCWERTLSEDQVTNQERARVIWRHALPINGTVAELYLRNRGLQLKRFPPSLRFVERAWVVSAEHGMTRGNHPALIAAIQDSLGRLTAIQSTYLLADGSWHIGRTLKRKAKLVTGPMQDGAIRLAKAGAILGIAEGIETALAAQQIYSIPTWAATGQSRRKSILLPEIVREVILFADKIKDPEKGDMTTEQAVSAYRAQGVTVQVEYPPPEFSDYNEIVCGAQVAA